MQQRKEIIRNLSYPRSAHISPSLSRRTSATPSPKWRNFIALFVIGGLLFILNQFFSPKKDAPTTNEPTQISQEATVAAKKGAKDTSAMQNQFTALIAKYPHLEISVAAVDLQNDEVLTFGVDAPYIAASTAKLITAAYYLHQVEQGEATLTQVIGGKTAEQQLELMIHESDNAAWRAFNTYLGKENLQVYARENGAVTYESVDNKLVPKDIAIILQKLYDGELLNDKHTNLLLSHMNNPVEEKYLPTGIPPSAKIYHKAGYLKDRAHDAAIIDDGKYPYVLVVFSKAKVSYDFVSDIRLFQEFAKASAEAFID